VSHRSRLPAGAPTAGRRDDVADDLGDLRE
jgi:hypothetical protein